jgi:hypothetical protein
LRKADGDERRVSRGWRVNGQILELEAIGNLAERSTLGEGQVHARVTNLVQGGSEAIDCDNIDAGYFLPCRLCGLGTSTGNERSTLVDHGGQDQAGLSHLSQPCDLLTYHVR